MNITFNPISNYKTSVRRCKIGCNAGNTSLNQSFVTGSILEINTKNSKNMDAIIQAVEAWSDKDIYGKCIVESAKKQRKIDNRKSKNKIYAFTLQKDNLNNLDSSKILGLSEIIKQKKNEIEINFLQVIPKSAGKRNDKEYFNVGREFIKMLKSIPENKKIVVKADYRAANFYEKMNFEMINPKKLIYAWKRLRGVRLA